MKIKILGYPYESLADSEDGDTGELVGFVRGGNDHPYAIIV